MGEYPSIFSYYSLLTLSHSCNFTPRTLCVPRLGLQLVGGPDPPLGCRSFDAPLSEVPQSGCAGGSSARPLWRFLSPLGHRSSDASASEVPQPGRVRGSSAWTRRRFLSLDASEVPKPGRVRGSSPPPRPSPSSDLGGSEVPPFSACGPPWVSQSPHTLSTKRRVITVSLSQDPLHVFTRRFLG